MLLYLACSILRSMRFKYVQMQFRGSLMATPKWDIIVYVYIANIFKHILLMDHWSECINIWHETPLGPGDSSLWLLCKGTVLEIFGIYCILYFYVVYCTFMFNIFTFVFYIFIIVLYLLHFCSMLVYLYSIFHVHVQCCKFMFYIRFASWNYYVINMCV